MKIIQKLTLVTISSIVITSCVPRSFLDRLNSLEETVKEQQEQLDSYEQRLRNLELICAQINTNITGIQTIIQSISNNFSITSVAPVMSDGKEIGFIINYSNGTSTTLYHGQNGKDGVDGKDGLDGKDGVDGKDGKDGADGTNGEIPAIGVKADKNGKLYWTINGEWMLDGNGKKVAIDQSVKPRFIIEDGDWYVSYDNGKTWELVDVYGEKAKPEWFSEVSYDSKNLYLTLSDGTVLTIPIGK